MSPYISIAVLWNSQSLCLRAIYLVKNLFVTFFSINFSNETWTHDHLVCKRTLKHLAKLAKWLGYVVITYLNSASIVQFYQVTYAFKMNLHLLLPEFQGAPCPSQAEHWKFNPNKVVFSGGVTLTPSPPPFIFQEELI